MGLFPTRHLSRFFRRSGTPSSSGTRYPSIPTYSPRGNLLPTTSNNPGVPLYTACSIPLTFLAGATVILFVFTCWLATAESLHSIYPTSHHNFRNSIDDHDSLGIILRPREPSIYYGQQQIFELEEHEGGEKRVEKEIVRPEIVQEVKEAESRSKSRLWFKAEYTIEIPVCEGGVAVQSGGACIHKDGSRNGRRGVENNPIWVPATESVRVSFCTGYSSEEVDDSGDGWKEERSWDYVYPPKNGPSGVDTAPEWIYRVDKRPLEKWRSVDVSGRKHDTFFKTEMRSPTPGNRPQWQFLLRTEGVYINADAWNIYEEEVAVNIPVEKIKREQSRLFSIRRRAEVERVLMWRWTGRYGGCPGEMDGREVVLEAKDVPESLDL